MPTFLHAIQASARHHVSETRSVEKGHYLIQALQIPVSIPGSLKVHLFTAIQIATLGALWIIKSTPASLVFPLMVTVRQ